MQHKKRKPLLDEKPFKDWDHASAEFWQLGLMFLDGEVTRFELGQAVARFQFRLELTVEQVRRKNR